MMRPKLARQELEAKIKNYVVPEMVKLVGIRGYYKNSMGKPGENDIGIYDDALFLIGPAIYIAFNGNTDPSKRKPGIAKLIPGVHYFKKGKHGLSKPGGGYSALRPDTPDESLPVTRDGKEGIHKGIAINIHKGSYSGTSSEGCQTIFPDQWIQFITEVYHAMDIEGQRRIPYILIEE
jgi:lysozyme